MRRVCPCTNSFSLSDTRHLDPLARIEPCGRARLTTGPTESVRCALLAHPSEIAVDTLQRLLMREVGAAGRRPSLPRSRRGRRGGQDVSVSAEHDPLDDTLLLEQSAHGTAYRSDLRLARPVPVVDAIGQVRQLGNRAAVTRAVDGLKNDSLHPSVPSAHDDSVVLGRQGPLVVIVARQGPARHQWSDR